MGMGKTPSKDRAKATLGTSAEKGGAYASPSRMRTYSPDYGASDDVRNSKQVRELIKELD